MAKIRKINVSEILGRSPFNEDNDSIMPAGTIVVYEGNNGDYVLRVHDGVTDGGKSLNITPIEHTDTGTGYTSTVDLDYNFAVDVDDAHLDINGDGSWSIGSNNFDTKIFSNSSMDNPDNIIVRANDHDWTFSRTGNLTLPINGDILDSNGNSVLGSGSTPNVWVQTFASEDGYPADLVSMASSVEYDIAGNVIALFTHATGFVDNNPVSSYYSVAKFTAAGLKLWQVRLSSPSTITYTDGWGLAVDNVDNRIYVAGRVEVEGFYNQSSLVKLNSEDGSLIWSNIYDFGAASDSPVVDVDSEGNPIVVGYYSTEEDTNDGVTVTKIDRLDGSIIWSRLLDGQNDDEAYGMAVGPNNEVVAVGYMAQYDEPVSHPVTPQTGSGVNVLVINRSDLGGDTLTDTWEVAGTGITGTIGVNAINVYTGLTGTVREGSGATFDFVIAGDGSITNPVTVANGGTNYLPGHKIKIPYTLIGGADANSDIILTVTGATDGVITSVAAGFYGGGAGSPNNYWSAIGTNYQTGSGLTFDLEMNSDSTYTEHPYNISAGGTNYANGDTVTIPGTQLGGTTPENNLITTVTAVDGVVTGFNTFSGNAQTTTYRVRTDDEGIDFSGTGTWTLSGVVVDPTDRMLVVKYDTTGAIQWQKAIQFDEGYDCAGADADIDADGNIYVCGNYEYDGNAPWDASAMNIVKFNSSGVKQWSRRVSGECEDFAASIVVGLDNNLYLSGVTASNDAERYIMVAAKYSTSGTVIWQRLLENTTSWSFVGGWFIDQSGGSNLAVRDGYVAFGGSFGNLGNSEWPTATVIQMEDDGTIFATGDWQISAASFSGTLSSDASDITVVDAGKTDSNIASGIGVNATPFDIDSTNFLIPTLYGVNGADSQLTNGAYTLNLENTGAVTLPAGGTITEGYVTSNPTIQLTPASPDVASQKLVIKGGGAYTYTDNGIEINYNTNTAIVGDTLTFYIYSNTYADQTLYWWIYPEGANISDPGSGTVVLDGSSGTISFVLDSDDNEFTVRVSPENNNYDPTSLGVESGLINPDAPTFDSEHHLHLTTGNLAETSIFLGTDDQNVRTTVNGGIQITTPNTTNNVWNFDVAGDLNLPDNGGIVFDRNNTTIRVGMGFHIASGEGISLDAIDQTAILNLSGAGNGPVNQTYNKTNDTLYTGNDNSSVTVENLGGTWYVLIDGDSKYTSNDLIGWALSTGPGPVPVGVLSNGYKSWGFSPTGNLTLPNDAVIRTDGSNVEVGGVTNFNVEAAGVVNIYTDDGAHQWQFGDDGSTTLPGALVNSTVAKTGVAYNTGTATALSDSTYIGAIVDGNYGPFTRGLVTFTVVVTGGVAAYTVTNTTGNTAVNDVIGTLDTGDLGGTFGSTSNISVADVIQAVTALDLTKSVNKLTDGVYTLADGVEGQIMYFVRQTGTNNATVIVANARVAGDQYTALEHYPFTTGDMNMLIFTDGAWQAMGGAWD